eukprot:CAMPEP_0179119718 /NCGR_PEP_ID=MMETSP0796-20121207/56373_1 /TAXON_ID=73915 /ORGANISM="Pyrodinium bahamense, Strain pbaha01" /LENGTH=319 /DNA_ID=CAMNT_0020818235 /DNA_START=136 /DNA_END=1096 /DNA_ORIENTATION=+
MLFRFIVPIEEMHELRPDKDADKLEEVRKKFLAFDAKQYEAKMKGWQTWEAKIPVQTDGGEPCKVFVHRPPDAGDATLPLLFWIHSGGFVLMSGRCGFGAAQVTRMHKRGVPVVWASVDYSLSPDQPFPAGFNDCWHCLQAFLHDGELARQYGYDPRRVHLAGASAGGGLAAGLVYELQRAGGEDLAAVRSAFVMEPMLEPLQNTGAYIENGDSRIAPVRWLGGRGSRADPRMCPHLHKPALAPGGQFIQLLVTTALGDALRDDGRAYAKTLRDAGAQVNHIENRGAHTTGLMFDKEKGEAIFSAWEELLRSPEAIFGA